MSPATYADTRIPDYALEWPALRAAILGHGGIGTNKDWSRHDIPGGLYRRQGLAPDLIAAEVTIGRADLPPWGQDADDSRMFAYCRASYGEYQSNRAKEPYRLPRWMDVYELSEKLGLAVRTIWLIVDEAELQPRRMPDVPRRMYFDLHAIERALKAKPRKPRAKRKPTAKRVKK